MYHQNIYLCFLPLPLSLISGNSNKGTQVPKCGGVCARAHPIGDRMPKQNVPVFVTSALKCIFSVWAIISLFFSSPL